jgi:hypothetical protein
MDAKDAFQVGVMVGVVVAISVYGIVSWVRQIPGHQETLRLIATGEAEIKPHTIAPDGTVLEWQLVPVEEKP